MDALAEIYRAFGEEGLKKARRQERLRVYGYLLGLLFTAVYTALWYLSGAAERLPSPLLAAYAYALGLVLFNFPLAYFFGRYHEILLGTNRQGFWGWLWDWAKSSLVEALFLGTLIGAVFLAAQHAGKSWPIVAFLIIYGLVLALYLAQPYLVRLTHRAEPLDDPELNAHLARLFESAGLRYRGVYLLRESEKSSRGNAMVIASPKGGYEVHVYDTLLEAVDPDAILAVVAHEVGHIVHRDLALSYAAFGLVLFLSVLVADLAAAMLGPLSAHAVPLFAGTLLIIFQLLQIPLNTLGRVRERMADRVALAHGDPEAFARALVALAKQNFADPDPPAWIETLLHNHPSLKKRLKRIELESTGSGQA